MFPNSWECHHPNWRWLSYFSEGWRKTTNQLGFLGSYFRQTHPKFDNSLFWLKVRCVDIISPVICEFKMKTLGRYSWDILTAGRVSDCWSNDWRLLDKMQYVCCTPIMWSGWNIILIGYSCRKPQWLENMESNKPRFPVLLIYCGWTKPCTSR